MLPLTLNNVIPELGAVYNLDFLDHLRKIPKARAFLFGGMPRDLVLGRKWNDADMRVILSGTVAEREQAIDRAIHGETIQEKIYFRALDISVYRFLPKGSAGTSPVDLSVAPSLSTNLPDLTLNSIYFDLVTGEVLDRFGAIQDIENKLIRAVSEPVASRRNTK